MADKYQPQHRTHSTWLTNINPNTELTQPDKISTPTENSLNMVDEYQSQQRTNSTWLTKYQAQQRTHSTWWAKINPNIELTKHGRQISIPTENSLKMAYKYQPQQRTHSTWLTKINPNRELTQHG